MKARIFPSDKILNTHDLRTRVTQHLEVPESDIEGYIPYYTIEDEDQNSEPRFTVIFSNKKNLAKFKSGLLQTDATYRLNWMGFPVFVALV